MNPMKTKKFDAVAESRRWKAAVARETEGMSREQVLAFFDKDRVLAAMRAHREADEPVGSVREVPTTAPASNKLSADQL
jgi:hypothetical protein